jgi:5'-methylthioadenosine phosphorylase
MNQPPVLAEIGVIGGSGLYALLDGATEHVVSTPYGEPSDPITIAEVGGRRVAFLPRHGRDHRYPPHRIPYRANLWALRALGVRQIIAPCAVGGLRPGLGPGTFVVPDQLIDRTSGRAQTFYDTGAVHISFADPYCPDGRTTVLAAAADVAPVDGGTMVVVEGPRFSTRAESRWFTSIGGTIVNMTGHPEAVLARELALCYTTIALVTDLDAGVEGDHGVT